SFGVDGGRTFKVGGVGTPTMTVGTTTANVTIDLNASSNGTAGGSDAGSGILQIASGATFSDQTSNNMSIQATNWGPSDNGTTAEVDNFGTLIKGSAGGSATNSTIGVKFVNSGAIDVKSGMLTLNGAVTNTG